ncbi:hypothetical protein K438DRAFT_1788313 [Mycena galopus ATCC 62051]|nr:hypothetical protein K438DRAFT_1788313 [Mycena galopus ATCC 62051]
MYQLNVYKTQRVMGKLVARMEIFPKRGTRLDSRNSPYPRKIQCPNHLWPIVVHRVREEGLSANKLFLCIGLSLTTAKPTKTKSAVGETNTDKDLLAPVSLRQSRHARQPRASVKFSYAGYVTGKGGTTRKGEIQRNGGENKQKTKEGGAYLPLRAPL